MSEHGSPTRRQRSTQVSGARPKIKKQTRQEVGELLSQLPPPEHRLTRSQSADDMGQYQDTPPSPPSISDESMVSWKSSIPSKWGSKFQASDKWSVSGGSESGSEAGSEVGPKRPGSAPGDMEPMTRPRSGSMLGSDAPRRSAQIGQHVPRPRVRKATREGVAYSISGLPSGKIYCPGASRTHSLEDVRYQPEHVDPLRGQRKKSPSPPSSFRYSSGTPSSTGSPIRKTAGQEHEDPLDILLQRMQNEIRQQREREQDIGAIPIRRFHQPSQSGLSRGAEMMGQRLARRSHDSMRRLDQQSKKDMQSPIHDWYDRNPDAGLLSQLRMHPPQRRQQKPMTPQERAEKMAILRRMCPTIESQLSEMDSNKAREYLAKVKAMHRGYGQAPQYQHRDLRKDQVAKQAAVTPATEEARKRGGLHKETIGEEGIGPTGKPEKKSFRQGLTDLWQKRKQ